MDLTIWAMFTKRNRPGETGGRQSWTCNGGHGHEAEPTGGDRRKAVMDLTMGAMVTMQNRPGQERPEGRCHGPYDEATGRSGTCPGQGRPDEGCHGPHD
jgi:hypothetical protein